MAAQFLASAIAATCGLFAGFHGCLVVVACTWDTPIGLSAIAWMAAGFWPWPSRPPRTGECRAANRSYLPRAPGMAGGIV